jgi:hypothetical protein
MKTKPAALLLLVAHSEADTPSLERFAHWVRQVGPFGFVDAIMHIRHVAEERTFGRSFTPPRVRNDESRRTRGSSPAIQQVATILRKELGLGVGVAADLLLPMLSETVGRLPSGIAPRNKEGFDKWLARLEKVVGPSQLLHVVTSLRNSTAHDWPLRRRA